jgi:peptidoglycan/xylan/chitin deacetylase (PgdA/CDA1 family)
MTTRTMLTAAALLGISAFGVNSLLCYLRSRGLSVLMFHGLTNRRHSGVENGLGLHMQVSLFESLCARLASTHTVIPLEEAVALVRAGKPLPRRATVITFDDGYASNYHLALPILRRYNLPATVFIATDFVDNGAYLWPDRIEYALHRTQQPQIDITLGDAELSLPLHDEQSRLFALKALCSALKLIPQDELLAQTSRVEQMLGCALADDPHPPDIYQPLTWDEAKALADSGLVTLGAHTHRHVILGRCKIDTARAEIALSRQIIEQRTGVKVKTFAYPNGKAGDHTPETRRILEEMGFVCGLTTEEGFNPTGRSTDHLTLRRFGQPPSPWHLEAITSGLFAIVRSLLCRPFRQTLQA